MGERIWLMIAGTLSISRLYIWTAFVLCKRPSQQKAVGFTEDSKGLIRGRICKMILSSEC